MNNFFQTIVLFLFLVMSQNALAAEIPENPYQIAAEARAFFLEGKYKEASKLLETIAKNDKIDNNGEAFSNAIYTDFIKWDEVDEGTLKKVDVFVQENSEAATSYLVKAVFYIKYAWQARGSNYSNKVSKDSWALFYERLTTSEQALKKAIEINENLLVSYELSIELKKHLYEEEKFYNYIMALSDRYPSFLSLHLEILRFLEPKWGGSGKFMMEFSTYLADKFSQEHYMRSLPVIAHLSFATYQNFCRHQGIKAKKCDQNLKKYYMHKNVKADFDKYVSKDSLQELTDQNHVLSRVKKFTYNKNKMPQTSLYLINYFSKKMEEDSYFTQYARGNHHAYIKNHSDAVMHYLQANKHVQGKMNYRNADNYAYLLHRIAYRYHMQKKYKEATEYVEKSLEITQKYNRSPHEYAHWLNCLTKIKLKTFDKAVIACTGYIDASADYQAYLWRAVAYKGLKEDEKAKQDYKFLENQKDPKAIFKLAEIYKNGDDIVQKDIVLAMALYKKAANNGYVHAQYILGLRYKKGKYVVKDIEEAQKWFLMAANNGNAKAQLQVALYLQYDEADYEGAFKWYSMAYDRNEEARKQLNYLFKHKYLNRDGTLGPKLLR